VIVQRLASSPLSDGPVNFNASSKTKSAGASQNETTSTTDDEVYICGARTQKGTPCRRRVHFAGERCYQHKGMPAVVPVDKLVIRPTNQSK
jgi:hypothetical protein